MPSESTEIARSELYELVWTVPATRLAERFGVSTIAFGKVCARHRVPRPQQGYWTKVEHGKDTVKMPLPPNEDSSLDTVLFGASTSSVDPATPDHPRYQIKVADKLTSPHHLVLATKRHMDSQEPGYNGLIDGATESTLAIHVGPRSAGRALRLFDAVLKCWERLGGTATPTHSWFDRTLVTSFSIGEDYVYLRLQETVETVDKTAPRWHRKRRPTGQLVFTIDSRAYGLRRSWADGKRQVLEDRLVSLIDGLLVQVEACKIGRLDDECEARQKTAVQERRDFSKRAQQAETQRREELWDQVQKWNQARQIREYLDHIKEMVESGQARMRDADAHLKWRAWAYWYAATLDPLFATGGSPLAEAPPGPVNTPVGNLDLTSRAKKGFADLGITDTDMLSKVTEREVEAALPDRPWLIWAEIACVLEARGYDVSGRS